MAIQLATLAGGCFWCTEAIFRRLKGVGKVMPGYTGGATENPTYEQVCSGKTGHAEAIQIEFDPVVIPYAKLLEIFFYLHDPTTLNRQGNDSGTQYRSAIFYHDETQKTVAEQMKNEIKGAVTEISPYTKFYPAEKYHKEYYEKNSYQSYCQYVIDPKLTKLLQQYRQDIKQEYLT